MLDGLRTSSPDVEVTLYSNRDIDVPLPRGNWRLRVDHEGAALPHVLWLQTRCPELLAADHVDVFWGQNYLIPHMVKRSCARLLTVHDVVPVLFPQTTARKSRLISGVLFRKSVRSADRVLVVSLATLRLVRVLLGAEVSRLALVYQGCARHYSVYDRQQAQSEVARMFGVEGEFLLTVGNIEPRKDHLTLLGALRFLQPVPKLVVVGSPGWRCGQVLAEMTVCQDAGHVKFLRWVQDKDLRSLYNAATAFVYPSFYEGFGIPVLEAMACGCPVICCRSSSLPEVGGDAVCYFRPHDAADLAKVLRQVMEDVELRSEMRRRGLVRAARFGQATAGSRLSAVLRSVVAERRGQSAGGSDPAVSRAGGPAWQ